MFIFYTDSGLYFVKDENNFINPDPMKKVPDPVGKKSTDPTGSESSSLPTTLIFCIIQTAIITSPGYESLSR